MRLEGQAKGGYYPTPLPIAEMIGKAVQPIWHSKKIVRILDPCCGDGEPVRLLANNLGRYAVETYGVELHSGRASDSAVKLDRVLDSDIFNVAIANRSFSVLFLNPPYDFDAEDGRTELQFLTANTKYLAEFGRLFYIVPKHRLRSSARYLATHYRQPECFRFPDPYYDDFDQVIVTAIRCTPPSYRSDDEWAYQAWGEALDIPPLTRLRNNAWRCPLVEKGDILFMRRRVDPAEAAREAASKGLWANRRLRDTLAPPDIPASRPLMELKQGHIALLMASGFLDNIVIGPPERPMLVKGQMFKESYVTAETEETVTYNEKLVTRVTVLDLLTGEFEELTEGDSIEVC